MEDGYREIDDISELAGMRVADMADLSGLDLRDKAGIFTGPARMGDTGILKAWSDRVIWPAADRIPKGFNPLKILEEAKKPTLGVTSLHRRGIDGRGVSIAIIDQRLNLDHPDYKDNIKHYERIEEAWKFPIGEPSDYHGSLVAGNAAGKTTGTAPGADVYYIASNNWIRDENGEIRSDIRTSEHDNRAIRRIIDINRALPEDKKIRFLSCSWGSEGDLYAEERERLFDEAEADGIMVLGGYYDCLVRNERYLPFDVKYPPDNDGGKKTFFVPTDGKTTPYYKGGFAYERLGGASSTYPYLAGVFALALQANPAFARRKGWQAALMEIAYSTSSVIERDIHIINPPSIVLEVERRKSFNTARIINPAKGRE
jgi:hypothetical protein